MDFSSVKKPNAGILNKRIVKKPQDKKQEVLRPQSSPSYAGSGSSRQPTHSMINSHRFAIDMSINEIRNKTLKDEVTKNIYHYGTLLGPSGSLSQFSRNTLSTSSKDVERDDRGSYGGAGANDVETMEPRVLEETNASGEQADPLRLLDDILDDNHVRPHSQLPEHHIRRDGHQLQQHEQGQGHAPVDQFTLDQPNSSAPLSRRMMSTDSFRDLTELYVFVTPNDVIKSAPPSKDRIPAKRPAPYSPISRSGNSPRYGRGSVQSNPRSGGDRGASGVRGIRKMLQMTGLFVPLVDRSHTANGKAAPLSGCYGNSYVSNGSSWEVPGVEEEALFDFEEGSSLDMGHREASGGDNRHGNELHVQVEEGRRRSLDNGGGLQLVSDSSAACPKDGDSERVEPGGGTVHLRLDKHYSSGGGDEASVGNASTGISQSHSFIPQMPRGFVQALRGTKSKLKRVSVSVMPAPTSPLEDTDPQSRPQLHQRRSSSSSTGVDRDRDREGGATAAGNPVMSLEKERIERWKDLKLLVSRYDLERAAGTVEIGRVLGRGKFSCVYEGEMSVPGFNEAGSRAVESALLGGGTDTSAGAANPSGSDVGERKQRFHLTKSKSLKRMESIGSTSVAAGGGGEPTASSAQASGMLKRMRSLAPSSSNLDVSGGDRQSNAAAPQIQRSTSNLYTYASVMIAVKQAQYNKTPMHLDDHKVETGGIPPTACSIAFHREIVALMALNSPCVVALKGVIIRPTLSLLLEFMPEGNLAQKIEESKWQVR